KGAEDYDFLKELLNDYSFFVSNMSPKKGIALDIGCGSGVLVEKLASYYYDVVGIDISNQMLDLAKSKRQRTNTVYLNMNAEQLNCNEKFDFIVSRTTFHHLYDIASVIQQMKELLNEEGRIVILDNVSEVE
ncbi:class I SAM-dependent methyltransferase, partial [Staphylococcus aureus]|uniref:class I SAM-dependent methyltransferase n=1 Tax=Staphylococcus aureus TaxID=1280 RepID=UPI0021087B81